MIRVLAVLIGLALLGLEVRVFIQMDQGNRQLIREYRTWEASIQDVTVQQKTEIVTGPQRGWDQFRITLEYDRLPSPGAQEWQHYYPPGPVKAFDIADRHAWDELRIGGRYRMRYSELVSDLWAEGSKDTIPLLPVRE